MHDRHPKTDSSSSVLFSSTSAISNNNKSRRNPFDGICGLGYQTYRHPYSKGINEKFDLDLEPILSYVLIELSCHQQFYKTFLISNKFSILFLKSSKCRREHHNHKTYTPDTSAYECCVDVLVTY